jgi:AraC family transcriptional regulator, alkane utilization regulator
MNYSYKAGPPDALTDVLSALRLTSRLFSYSQLSAPWALELPPTGSAYFHVVEGSGGWIRLKDDKEARLFAGGDLVVIPHGGGHIIGSDGKAKPLTLKQFIRLRDEGGLIKHGGGGPETNLVCGSFQFENGIDNPLISLLPKFLQIRGAREQPDGWLDSTLRQLVYEARYTHPGSQMMVTRLTDLIFVQAVRVWLASQPRNEGGWLGALRDRQIGLALGLMHRDPGHDWSVESLADEASMSRSKFAAKFKRLVRESPLAYLNRLRLDLAATMLVVENNLTVGEVSHRVGYDSETAFSTAFKRRYGKAPGTYRRQPPDTPQKNF